MSAVLSALGSVGVSGLIPCKIVKVISVKYPPFLPLALPSVLFNKYREKTFLRDIATQAVSHQAGIDRYTQQGAYRQARNHKLHAEGMGGDVGHLCLVKGLQREVLTFLSLMPHKHNVVSLRLSSVHLKDTNKNISNREHRSHLGIQIY